LDRGQRLENAEVVCEYLTALGCGEVVAALHREGE
jgi:hypothetical protein